MYYIQDNTTSSDRDGTTTATTTTKKPCTWHLHLETGSCNGAGIGRGQLCRNSVW
jgi:hypothetical protein